MTRPKDRAHVARPTPSRRTVLEWLGAGAALSLGGAALLPGCAGAPATNGGEGGVGLDGGAPDTLLGDGPIPDSWLGPQGDGGLPFSPGDKQHQVYKSWGERTVDVQDLEQILASWKLTVDGLVASPRTYTFADLVGLGLQSQVTDFHCVEGWSVYDVPWNGVHLSKIFAQVKPSTKADYITFHTIGGTYNESLLMKVALEKRTILGLGVGGRTLPLSHGFPLRVVIPRLLGYKNAKYVERIELTDKPVHGFWVKVGYSYYGEVSDSRLRPGKY
jgi:DMSO/TMAO reductase YedYZ molybdopterin-dependent catalytic subunit